MNRVRFQYGVSSLAFAACLMVMTAPPVAGDEPDRRTIEEKTHIHRLSTSNRAPYDAFVYVNRIPERPRDGESATDLAGRIFGRLANQEGRILLKLPEGMDREAYLAYKTFLSYEPVGEAPVGNCAACHTPAEFTDFKTHVVTKGGEAKPTPSLRNLGRRQNIDLEQVLVAKIAAAKQKQSGEAAEIADAYAKIRLTEQEIPGLIKFLKQLNDVADDATFRKMILDATVLDTSAAFE